MVDKQKRHVLGSVPPEVEWQLDILDEDPRYTNVGYIPWPSSCG